MFHTCFINNYLSNDQLAVIIRYAPAASDRTHLEAMSRRTHDQEKFEDTKGVIEEGQTTQWPKEKGQKDKHRSTKQYT